MGREARRVPAGWEHPRDNGRDWIPLFPQDQYRDYEREAAEWEEGKTKWAAGLRKNYGTGEPWISVDEGDQEMPYEEWAGEKPNSDDYMPKWTAEEATHYQMYETVTEGTPISPVMELPEALARWLTDNDANAGAGMHANYKAWLRVCRGGYAPSMVLSGGKLRDGVTGLADV